MLKLILSSLPKPKQKLNIRTKKIPPIPAPRTKKIPPIPAPRTKKIPPIPAPRTKKELNELNFYQLRKYAKSIKGIGKYGNLNKNELLKLILSSLPKPKQKLNIRTKKLPAPRN